MKLQAFFSVVLAKASLLAPQQFEAIMKQEVRRLALARRCGLFLCAVATNDTAVASHEVRNVLSHGLLPNLGLHAQPTHEENPGGRGSSKPDASPSFLVASSGPSRAHYRDARSLGYRERQREREREREAAMAEAKQLRSFVEVPVGSHFPIQNLPFGVFRRRGGASPPPRPAVAIGEFVVDLAAVADAGLFDGPVLSGSPCFHQETLNMFLGMGRPAWKEARPTLQKILSADEPVLRDNEALKKKCLVPMSDIEMLLPMTVGAYTDFFCSVHHARNCGFIFRGPQTPVNPNWFHLPIGYNGRASSVVVSGTDVIRPRGQGHPTGNSTPYFGPSQKLDFELEMAAVVGPGNELGKPIDINDAEEHIFGLVLMNDWSARDIQAWETIPLGPFLGKSFSTTISPWIVTLDALKPFACEAPKQEPEPLPYLAEKSHINYDIPLEIWIKPNDQSDASVVAKTNFKHLYWTVTQQLAHHTVNGCNMRPGDIFATGTLSGPEPDSLGCLLELTWNGQKEIPVGNSTRKFLEDGDEVILTGCCKGEDYNIGFGTCTGEILPAHP